MKFGIPFWVGKKLVHPCRLSKYLRKEINQRKSAINLMKISLSCREFFGLKVSCDYLVVMKSAPMHLTVHCNWKEPQAHLKRIFQYRILLIRHIQKISGVHILSPNGMSHRSVLSIPLF